uniref:3-oxoacyl-ACP synthase III family protein n=1 Tax=Desertifilum tharense IPPAS B-1220 TaxID=1781255 RepID=A0ACD5GWA6_9CYAN
MVARGCAVFKRSLSGECRTASAEWDRNRAESGNPVAIEEAIAAANLQPDDIDLAIATSLFSDTLGFGQYAKLGLRCPAWNLESTCASALVALQTSRALIQTGEYRHILVVVSQMGSKAVEETDTLSWSMGDAAGAFIVSEMPAHQGVLATHIISARAAAGAYTYELASDRLQIRTGDNASAIAETAVDFVRTCTQAVLDKAGVSLQEINGFAFNTPTAWYASVCARALGIDPARTWNLYPRYANIEPVFPLANLDWAARSQKLKENDLILVYANGAGATAVATVMRWGDVALGCEPAPLKQRRRPNHRTASRTRTHPACGNSQLIPRKTFSHRPQQTRNPIRNLSFKLVCQFSAKTHPSI